MALLYLIAGEASGDRHGAALIRSLQERDPELRFAGAGGPEMAALCQEPFLDWSEEAVVGLWDVLKKYGYFRKQFHRMQREIDRLQPAAVVFIDYPGFNLRLAKALRKSHPRLKLIYFISPQVWAWNRGRIPRMARMLDLMLCIFPFEPELYQPHGLRTEFVGHPLLDHLEQTRLEVDRNPELVGLFPGSREREVRRILPVQLEGFAVARRARPELKAEVSLARSSLEPLGRELMEQSGIDSECLRMVVGDSHRLMQEAGAGLVASGTATLEAACYGLPYALVYKVAWPTYWVGRCVVRVPHLGIINLIAKQEVVREFLQGDASGPALGDELLRLLNHREEAERLSRELRDLTRDLGRGGSSERAATAILSELER